MVLRLPVFLWVTLVSRRKANSHIQSGDYTTWHRDESSRT